MAWKSFTPTISRCWRLVANAVVNPKHPGKLCLARALQRKQAVQLDEARMAIRLGFESQALAVLELASKSSSRKADCLNLLGVTHERLGNFKLARKLYGKATRCNRMYRPAQQNLLRLYELTTFGRSQLAPQLGDERPALGALLDQLNLESAGVENEMPNEPWNSVEERSA